MIRAIVFDLDGTLIDSWRDIADAVNATLADLERPPRPSEAIKTMIGHGARRLLSQALGTEDPEILDAARAVFWKHYRSRLTHHTRPYDGVLDLIATLHQRGLIIAIATNKPADFTQAIVRELGFDKAGVRASASPDETVAAKPNPAVLRLALERAGFSGEPRDVAYAGDMPIDIRTARAFGAKAIGVTWGFFPESLKDTNADLLISAPNDLIEWLEREEK